MTKTVAAIMIAVALGAAGISRFVLIGDAAQRAHVTDSEAQIIAEFHKRVSEYVALQKKISDSLKPLPKEASPLQIDENQRQFSRGIVTARANAKPGDIFYPAMRAYTRGLLMRVFRDPDGKQLRASILDENPITTPVRINGPYPDAIPLSTMPPKVLAVVPKLPDTLEYRFVGERLILFDNHAHIIVDYVDRALPQV